jgi:hypothetical protein
MYIKIIKKTYIKLIFHPLWGRIKNKVFLYFIDIIYMKFKDFLKKYSNLNDEFIDDFYNLN